MEFAQSAPAALQCISDAGTTLLILILSDINMPGMSGLELLPKAKALRPDVPVIMITAYGDAETKRKALENGAEALLTKPIDFAMLRNEIDVRVDTSRMTGECHVLGKHRTGAHSRHKFLNRVGDRSV
jgi:CheY-like chemotaxis protein